MEIKHIIGNLYSIYGEYYIQLKKSPTDPPIVLTMIDIDYLRIKNQYYVDAIDYIQANCGHDVWIYPNRKGITVELATDEIKSEILFGLINYISDSYCIRSEDNLFKIIFNKN